MCTMSWLLDPEGYRVFFNRDERRTRRPARPPEAGEGGGVRFLAPRDGDHGGSWLLAAETGLTLALLNLYEAERPPLEGEFRSRGLLVLDLADLEGPEALEMRLEAAGPERYQPFLPACLDLLHWSAVDHLRFLSWYGTNRLSRVPGKRPPPGR